MFIGFYTTIIGNYFGLAKQKIDLFQIKNPAYPHGLAGKT
jgi:hypothetical protein